jgi:hypothetical protein
LPAFDALPVEPSHSTAHKADGRGLLLVCEHLDVGEPCGVVDGHVDTVVADASRAALLAAAGDAMTDLAKAGKLFDINVDQVTRPLPLVAVDWWFGVQGSQPPQPQAVENPRHGGEGRDQHLGVVAEVEALVTEIHGLLQLLRIERPPLGAANTASIRERSSTA